MGAHKLPEGEELMSLGRDADAMARVLKLLANPERLRMLCRMGMGDMDGGTQPTVGAAPRSTSGSRATMACASASESTLHST